MDMESLRERINEIDRALVELLGQRREVSRAVIEHKCEKGLPLRDTDREEDLLGAVIQRGRELGVDAHFVTRVFHEIIDDSVRSQQLVLQKGLNHGGKPPERVAYQGIDGAYSHLAARKFFASETTDIAYTGYPTFAEVVEIVEEGIADFGLLPVENTTAGNINEVYDLLYRAKLHVIGEEIFHVRHCLLGLEKVPFSRLRRILSHPQALAQCTRFLSQLPGCNQQVYLDTAMAVRKVKEDGDPDQAAIASEEAGKIHGLVVLQRDLADQPENFTRFLVVARKPIRVDPRIASKTSMIMVTEHRPGALNQALDVFYRHSINLTKLDARPKPGSPFEYVFYVDFVGNREEEHVRRALDGLRGATTYLKILGSYPREDRGRTRPTTRSFASRGPSASPAPVEDAPARQTEAAAAPETASASEHSAIGQGASSDAAETPPASAGPRARVQPSAVASEPILPPSSSASGTRPPRPVDRACKPEGTVVRIGDVELGGRDFVIIAGPCSVESQEQIRSCARHVAECGGRILRGGCFRPRTSPCDFAGLGFEGLELLVRAGREYDLPVVTEVLSPSDVEAVAELVDALQVGARNMQNFALLAEVGKTHCPVILKRGSMATIDELLDAAEYIVEQGNHQIVLCERGIRTFETVTRNTLDLGAVPALHQRTHLPLLVDPSHAAGRRDLVLPLALAARAVGPHGMMLEIHPDPERAMSDGPQALTFDDFSELMETIFD